MGRHKKSTLLIKEQEASYVTSNIGGTIPLTGVYPEQRRRDQDRFKNLLKEGFYSPSEIIALFKSKKIDKEWSFIEYKPSDTSKLTHCCHRYPAKITIK